MYLSDIKKISITDNTNSKSENKTTYDDAFDFAEDSLVTPSGITFQERVRTSSGAPSYRLNTIQEFKRGRLFRCILKYTSDLLNHTEVMTKPASYHDLGMIYSASKEADPGMFMAYTDEEKEIVTVFYTIDGVGFVDRISPLHLLNKELKMNYMENVEEVTRWYLYIVNCLTSFNQGLTFFINIDNSSRLKSSMLRHVNGKSKLPFHEFSYMNIPSYDTSKSIVHHWSRSIIGYDTDTSRQYVVSDKGEEPVIVYPEVDMTGIEDRLYDMFTHLIKTQTYVGADTETTGLDVFDDELVSLGLTFNTRFGFYLSFKHKPPKQAVMNIGERGVITYLANLDRTKYRIANAVRFMRYYSSSNDNLTDEDLHHSVEWLKKSKSIWHNAKFDWNILLTATGIRLPIFMDTMLAHYVTRPGYDIPARDKRGLKVIAPNELGIASWKIDITKCQYEAKDDAAAYNARDTCYMFAVALLLCPDLEKNWDLFTTEMRFLPVLMEAERSGIGIDVKKLRGIEVNLREKSDRIKNEFSSMFSEEDNFNINSGPMLKKLFFDKWGIIPPRKCMQCGVRHQEPHTRCVNPECSKYDTPDSAPIEFVTPAGDPKLDKYVLNALVQSGNQKAKDLIEYRAANKLVTSYCNLDEKIHHYDGMIHPQYVQNGTATGRLCVAKGTLIDIVRNMETDPKGIPIEDIRAGDYAFTLNSVGEIILSKITWAGKTGEKTQIVRIHWGTGISKGHLDVTPTHPIMTDEGRYRQARYLQPGDRMMSVYVDKTGKRVRTTKVVSKKEILNLKEKVSVYDLTVEQTHNFIASGICVHNSSKNPNFQSNV